MGTLFESSGIFNPPHHLDSLQQSQSTPSLLHCHPVSQLVVSERVLTNGTADQVRIFTPCDRCSTHCIRLNLTIQGVNSMEGPHLVVLHCKPAYTFAIWSQFNISPTGGPLADTKTLVLAPGLPYLE